MSQRAVAAEMSLCLVSSFVYHLAHDKRMVRPEQFVAILGTFGILAAVALLGPNPARIAAGIGGLVTLGIAVTYGGTVIGAVSTASGVAASPPGADLKVAPQTPAERSSGLTPTNPGMVA